MMSRRVVFWLLLFKASSALISTHDDEGAKLASRKQKTSTDFVTFMREKMTGKDWVEFMQACYKLRVFVLKYAAKEQKEKLDTFDIENLVKSAKYKEMIRDLLNDKTVDQDQFGNLMTKEMKTEQWKKLLHWILQYESATLFINPPPPEPAPAPLFEEPGFQIPDELILDFLEKNSE